MEVDSCLVIHVLFASVLFIAWEGGGEERCQAKQASCGKEWPGVGSHAGWWGGKLLVVFAECSLWIHKELLYLLIKLLTAFFIECLNISILLSCSVSGSFRLLEALNQIKLIRSLTWLVFSNYWNFDSLSVIWFGEREIWIVFDHQHNHSCSLAFIDRYHL